MNDAPVPVALYISLWIPVLAVMIWGLGRFWQR